MSLTLGEKLRQAREERGISISEVAEQTRISPHYLDSIENDDYRTLPGGIFNKGFVKSYAKYVGIDEQEALQDYARLIASQEGGAQFSDEPKTYKPEVLTDDRASGSMIPTIIIAVIILGLMSWGLIAIVNYIQNQQNQPAENNSNVAANANQTNSSVANTNTAPPPPATDKISAELKASGDDVWLSYSTESQKLATIIKNNESLKLEPKDFLKLTYPKDKAPSLQLVLNGQPISLPTAPANPKRNTIDVEITKENLGQILQNAQIAPVGAATR